MYKIMILEVYTEDGKATLNLIPEQMEKIAKVLELKTEIDKDGNKKIIAGGVTPYKLG